LSYGGLFSYVPGTSLFHRVAPLAKCIWVLCVWTVSIAFSDVYRLTPVVLIVLTAALYSGIFREVRSQLIGILATITLLILVQGLYNPGPSDVVLTLIPKQVPLIGGTGNLTSHGLLFGAAMSERFIAILFSSLVGIMTTSEEDITSFLSDVVRLPYTYVLIAVMALRFIPTIAEEFNSILDAQRARAFEPESMNIVKRLTTAYVPVMIPLATGAILKAEEVAISMQVRAFGQGKRTYRGRHAKMHLLDYAFISVTIALTAIYLGSALIPSWHSIF